jgi:hypothetical protein
MDDKHDDEYLGAVADNVILFVLQLPSGSLRHGNYRRSTARSTNFNLLSFALHNPAGV